VQAFTGDGLQALPSDSIAWWHKHTNGRAQEIFEIFPAIAHPSRQIVCPNELKRAIFLIVVVTVQHGLEPIFSDTFAKPLNKLSVLVQWMGGPLSPIFLGNTFTCSCFMEWNDGQRDWSPLCDFTVNSFQVIRRGEKACVVVTNAEIHAFLPSRR
jgi:hypothetical protein